ncbi:MAG TPA: LysR family transcriptional regulator [Tepidisphaeraceae bacterium]|nr:LysR family transcriptional regulator [Tepidisphaeraceae bacterium]
MNLGHLLIFHAVAQAGNLSRGAERLMISQPAASKQIAQLERALGIRLLDRLPRGVRLTEGGELLESYASRIFTLEAEAEEAMRELQGLRRGRLRIGASTTIGVYLLPEPFVRFRHAYPQIRTQLEVSNSATVEERLLAGELDLGFVETYSGHPELRAGILRQDELAAIASPAHALARKKRVSVEQLCREPFVVRDTGSETKSYVERELARRGLSVTPVMSLGSTEAIKRAVAAGIGLAVVSRLSIGLELETRRLRVLPVAGLALKRPLYELRSATAGPVPAFEAFRSLLTESKPRVGELELEAAFSKGVSDVASGRRLAITQAAHLRNA